MSRQHNSVSKIDIGFVSKSDESGGGASRVASQLRNLLEKHDSRFAVDHWVGIHHDGFPTRSITGGALLSMGYRLSRKISRAIGLPDFISTERLTFLLGTYPQYNLYHVHDISDAISPYTLKFMADRAPVVWTFHDCSPFTGGCIYPMDCVAYEATHCGNCPQLGNWPLITRIDRTSYMQAYKVSLINNSINTVICPSDWIATKARSAGISADLLNVIPNGVDTRTFKPQDKRLLRTSLELPLDADIVLLATMDFRNPYKGVTFARDALAAFQRPLYVLLVGANPESVDFPPHHKYISMPKTLDRELLAKYYACCDILLFPSMADNCPLVLLESMACGTPAVAFDSGGIKEIIRDQADGWLAKQGDLKSLIRGLHTALDNKSARLAWSQNARAKILEKYNEERFLQAHLSLYENLLSSVYSRHS